MDAINVAAGLIFRDRRLLIAQRPAGSHLAGFWEFPGGKCEPGETFEDSLVRELREELGTEVEVLSLIDSVTHAYPEKTVRLKFFRCRWVRSEPRALGCAALAWIGIDELENYQFPPADARLLERLRSAPELWD